VRLAVGRKRGGDGKLTKEAIGAMRTVRRRFLRRLPGPHAVRSARVAVTWQRGRIRRIRIEYVRPHLIRRLINFLRW
jgi:hypothetical protein